MFREPNQTHTSKKKKKYSTQHQLVLMLKMQILCYHIAYYNWDCPKSEVMSHYSLGNEEKIFKYDLIPNYIIMITVTLCLRGLPKKTSKHLFRLDLFGYTEDEKKGCYARFSAAWHLWMTHSSQAVEQSWGQQQRGLVIIDYGVCDQRAELHTISIGEVLIVCDVNQFQFPWQQHPPSPGSTEEGALICVLSRWWYETPASLA